MPLKAARKHLTLELFSQLINDKRRAHKSEDHFRFFLIKFSSLPPQWNVIALNEFFMKLQAKSLCVFAYWHGKSQSTSSSLMLLTDYYDDDDDFYYTELLSMLCVFHLDASMLKLIYVATNSPLPRVSNLPRSIGTQQQLQA